MNLSTKLSELLWDNPMTLEATRTLRRTLRAGSNNENPYATRKLNIFLGGTLVFLYMWTILGIVHADENVSMLLLMAELFLLTLIVPCSLYGAVAVEREKLTYESLILTRLTPAQIVCGKLWWRIGLIAGVMALFIPLLVASQLTTRSVELRLTSEQLCWTQVQIFTWSVFVGAFSLWVSAKSKKGITALLGIVASLLTFLVMVPLLLSLFNLTSSIIRPADPFGYDGRYSYGNMEQSFYQRFLMIVFAGGLLYALNPFWMVATLAKGFDVSTSLTMTVDAYWQMLGVNYWGVAVFALLSVFFVRAAIKTLRGLEMPVAEKVRKSPRVFGLGKRGA